jgi:TfoX/Sxy family transcriptional regulator of competence genes
MSTDPRTVAFIVDQAARAGAVSSKRMFGEYGLYCDGKMVALVCDDKLFVKPSPGGRAFAVDAEEAAPYPGAKPCLLVDADRWEDGDWLTELFRVTASELPLPKAKAGRAPRKA